MISKSKIYQNTKDKIVFKNLEEEFGMGENVLIFPEALKNDKENDRSKYFVQKGKVVGYT